MRWGKIAHGSRLRRVKAAVAVGFVYEYFKPHDVGFKKPLVLLSEDGRRPQEAAGHDSGDRWPLLPICTGDTRRGGDEGPVSWSTSCGRGRPTC